MNVDFFDYQVPPDSIILMCSDGLTNMVEDDDIVRILDGPTALSEKPGELIDEANLNGGKDNIAVVIVRPDADEV